MTTNQLDQTYIPACCCTPHEHGWVIESAHRTSLGRILYGRCTRCNARRVDLQDQSEQPPSAISALIRTT